MSLFSAVVDEFQTDRRDQTEPVPTLTDMLIAASKGIDLLEGRGMRHSIRVSVLAATLGRMMGLDARQNKALLLAGLLHDVGLAQIVADFAPRLPVGFTEKEIFAAHPLANIAMEKLPALSESSMAMLKTHPQAAATFIDAAIDSTFLARDVKAIVAASHELFDGSGYPFSLSGGQIPLEARILAFADVLETTLDQVGGLNQRREAVALFLQNASLQPFDPEVVETFRRLCLQEEDAFLRRLFSTRVEERVLELLQDPEPPLSGPILLRIARAMGTLPDQLMPLYTTGHSEKVAQAALGIAQHLGIDNRQCGELIIAGLLQNMGMLGIPVVLLLRPESLNPEQWSRIHDHPRYSVDILKNIPGFHNITAWVVEHHERMNGSGYPGGKRGFEISVAGRLLGIADVYAALTSPRPYRNHAYEPMDAIPVLGQGRFRLFDNPLVSVLRSVVLETQYVVSSPGFLKR